MSYLDALIQPRPLEELRACFEQDQPFVVHGKRDSLAELFAIPFLASLDRLLGMWPEQVQVHLPDVADEASSIAASPHDARKLFANGMGLLFEDVNRYAPVLDSWLAGIRGQLGLSRLTNQRSLMYATPANKGTAPHFDQNVNFVLQVHGTKRWSIAPNVNVMRPLTRHTMGLAVDPELQSYAELPMPLEMPSGAVDYVLEPGSILFVPRGAWHCTHAVTDALSLNFTFSAPTWLDVFGAALRSRLALSSEWRETAAPSAVETFDVLLRQLAADVTNWNATDILEATEG
ncbi:MAG TPA: cupin domain-containing protein [Kofleriaceae bacterium]